MFSTLFQTAFSAIVIFLQSSPKVTAQSCASNPMFSQALLYLQNIGNFYASAPQDFSVYSQTAIPQPQPLQVCTQFAASSCCTTHFEATLTNISYSHYWKYKNKQFYFISLSQNFASAIRTCSNNQDIQDPDQYNISSFNSIYNSYKVSVLRIIKANLLLIRGNLCSLCAPPASYSQYISTAEGNPQLIVSSEDINNYLNAVSNELQSQMQMKAEMKQGLLDYYNLVADPTNCGGVLQNTFDFINDFMLCPGGSCFQHVEERVGLLVQTIEDELVNMVLPDLQTTTAQFTQIQLSNPRLRQLSLSNNFIINNKNYLETYISQPSVDDELQYMGVYDGTGASMSNALSFYTIAQLTILSLFLIISTNV